MVTDSAEFQQRRSRFLEQLGEVAAVIPASPLVTHHADVEHAFRQNSDFWYLTGFDEPGAVALFLPHRAENPFVLFVQPKEPTAEVWNGFRWGCEGAVERFGADLAHPLAELPDRLGPYLMGAGGIAFRVGRHPELEPLVLKAWGQQLDRAPAAARRPWAWWPPARSCTGCGCARARRSWSGCGRRRGFPLRPMSWRAWSPALGWASARCRR